MRRPGPDQRRLRINADELRCRVLAEGGNLGMTQRAGSRRACKAAA
jgi:NAD-specific glutamate dehydrogenase